MINLSTRGRDAELTLARKVLGAQGGDDRTALLLSDACESLGARWIVVFRLNTLTREHDHFAVYENRFAGSATNHAQHLAPSEAIAVQVVEQAERDLGGWTPATEVRVAPGRYDDRGPEGNPHYAWALLPAGQPFVWCFGAIRPAADGPFPEGHEAILLRAAWTNFLLARSDRPLPNAAPTEPPWIALAHAMPVGIAVVNAERKVLFCNDTMQNLVALKDSFDVQDNRLVALRQEDDRKLDTLVRRSITGAETDHDRSYMALPRPAPHPAYGVAIQRVAADRAMGPVVTIQVSEADRGLELSRTAIREFFGLTPTESEIAARLADGYDISEIAAALEIRPGTVRVHLRSIYRKTHVSRQGELVRLVLCSVARFALR